MHSLGRALLRFSSIAVVGAVVGTTLIPTAQAAEISGAGATFPYPIYAKWAEAYKAATNLNLNYQSIGSGGGIKQIEAKTVDFGASDKPLKADELEKNGLVQWPMIMGGVVPVINLPGIAPGDVKLDGPTLAAIFLGKVSKWNDPAIVKLNAGVKLPATDIAVVHRSDGSGTTFNFTDYLSKVSPEWEKSVGEDTSVEWPTGLGGKGNEGVAALTTRTEGAIGYVEYAYALQNKMTYTKMINRDGATVAPETKTFQAAAANADWKNAPGFYLILTDQPGKASWPITATSFILMQKKADKPDNSKAVLAFFAWAYRHGDKLAESLDYVPMPSNVYALVETSWKEIKGPDGKPIWTGTILERVENALEKR
jgi:phosphate transport system substrate-binding protein